MTQTDYYDTKNFVAPNCVGYLISQAQAMLRPQIEALFEHEDISFSQWRVLMCLRDEVANTGADISRELSHDKGSVTRLIDQLAERGLLTRERDDNDRRVVFLALTPGGREALDRPAPKVIAYFNEVFSTFSEKEATLLIALLTKLTGVLRRRDEIAQPRERTHAT